MKTGKNSQHIKRGEEIQNNKAAAKNATPADPARATLFNVAPLPGVDAGEPAPGAAAMEGEGAREVGGAGGDDVGEAVGEEVGAEVGGLTVADGEGVGVATVCGGDATGAGEFVGEAVGDAPGACAIADPITKANIRATNILEKAIFLFSSIRKL